MADKPLCFIICPIGEADSETRANADYLLDLIIRPALEGFDLEILRGDHCHTPNQIHEHVVRCIREAALCIADISLPNVNVYYEVGRRDETGLPLILLRRSDAGAFPVDLGTRRYIRYSLDAAGITSARNELRRFVRELAKNGFETPKSDADSMSEKMRQMEERLLERLKEQLQSAAVKPAPEPAKPKASPVKSLFSKPKEKPAAKPAAPKPAAPAPKSAEPARKSAAPAKPQPQYSRTELDRQFREACEKGDVEKIDVLLDYIRTTPLADSPAFINAYVIAAWESGSEKAFSILCRYMVSQNN